LLFGGDISAADARSLAEKSFGSLQRWSGEAGARAEPASRSAASVPVKRLLVLDLPSSGQAAVTYATKIDGIGRRSPSYYHASVLNSLLGGGYSSRLNQEIRIKRGLSYGAGSSFNWRLNGNNFATRTQTKNESAAEVAELVLAEIKRLAEGEIPDAELDPRKSVLTGGFGRNIETTGGLVGALADLYTFGIPASELNSYMTSVNTVGDVQIREFSKANLFGGDIIIVGDYSKFKDDLAKRFPNIKVEVIPVSELDISQADLRK
jgi:zinc protease